MKQTMKRLTILAVVASVVSGCSLMSKSGTSADLAATTGAAPGAGVGPGGEQAVYQVSSSVPTAASISFRIQNALMSPTATPSPLVSAGAGNFAKAVAQQASNLSSTSNPITGTGAAAASLIAYAACNDVKSAAFGVNTGSSIASQTTPIVNAGVAIVNNCTANLAASGTSLNSQVSSIFSNLVSQNTTAGATVAQQFISVCTAATSFCVGMLGF